MSISIVDYISDYLYAEIIPASPIILIICEEHCLVPDSLKATSLFEIDKILILKGGLFIYRAGTSFDKGSKIGLALSAFPGSKLFTPRRESFFGIIPNSILEFLYQPTPSPKVQQSPGQSKSTNNSFEEIYNESLSKFTKTFLLDRALRAVKSRSLRAQAKNLIEGVIISFSRKYGKSEMVDSETIVDAMFEDFDRQGVLKVAYNSVEYNDALIEAYFGYHKTKIFLPGFETRSNGVVEAPVVSSNVPRIAQDFQGVNGVPQFFNKNPQNQGNFGFTNPGLNQNRVVAPAFSNTPRPPEPSYSPQQFFFQASNVISANRENSQMIGQNPSIFKGSSETPTRGFTNSPVRQMNNPFKPVILNSGNLINWEVHDGKIADEVLEKVSCDTDIDCLIKLFKVCNRITRDYLNNNNLQISNQEAEEKVKKNMKLAIQTFFECKGFDIDYNLENMKTTANVKLVRPVE